MLYGGLKPTEKRWRLRKQEEQDVYFTWAHRNLVEELHCNSINWKAKFLNSSHSRFILEKRISISDRKVIKAKYSKMKMREKFFHSVIHSLMCLMNFFFFFFSLLAFLPPLKNIFFLVPSSHSELHICESRKEMKIFARENAWMWLCACIQCENLTN